MKCCVSTDVRTWTNWLTFEPDLDYRPDGGTGLLSPISYALQRWFLLRQENPTYRYWAPVAATLQRRIVLKWRVTTLQTMWNYPTFPWRFAALLRGTRHVKCYSYHARTSVTVSGGGRNATVHDLIFKTQRTLTKYLYGHKYAVYNEQF